MCSVSEGASMKKLLVVLSMAVAFLGTQLVLPGTIRQASAQDEGDAAPKKGKKAKPPSKKDDKKPKKGKKPTKKDED